MNGGKVPDSMFDEKYIKNNKFFNEKKYDKLMEET